MWKSRTGRDKRPMNRREFLTAPVAGAAMLQPVMRVSAAAAAGIQVAIDTARTGEPITPSIFGGYMEPATTRVWAEMLTDRKFANPITPAAPQTSGPPMGMRVAS